MKLPEGWYEADKEEAERLGRELETELIQGHVLYNQNIKVVAHRDGASDDVLCKHIDKEDYFTVVHLTWSMKPEIDSLHPTVEVQGNYEEFLEWEARW